MIENETESKRVSFGLINRIAASSAFTTLKELVKGDYADEDELSKSELEELKRVMNEHDKLKIRINNKKQTGNNLKKDLSVQYTNSDRSKREVVKDRIELEQNDFEKEK